MQSINRQPMIRIQLLLMLCLLAFSLTFSVSSRALESDRQQPLEINASSTDGTLGDGITTMRGDVEIRQGSLHITADEAEVKKADGRVQSVTFRGQPAFLEQEIEDQGLIKATARVIDYQVANGLVTLTGEADVQHPQYHISGNLLTYDLKTQHFKGSGNDSSNGRIHIRLDPEVLDKTSAEESKQPKSRISDSPDPATGSESKSNSGDSGKDNSGKDGN